jgi:hypothetical protein
LQILSGSIFISLQPANSLAQQVDKSRWNTIFESNAVLAMQDPVGAKAQREAWKKVDGMMDAYDDWLDGE